MYRIKSFGDTSYFRESAFDARNVILDVLRNSGCGILEMRCGEVWRIVARFEPFYGIIM